MKKTMVAVIMVLVAAGIISSNSVDKDSSSDFTYVDDSWAKEESDDGWNENSMYVDYNNSGFYVPDSYYDEPQICSSCGGSGISQFRCTWCDGDGVDPAYELTEGSVLHAFAEKICPKCAGYGYPPCMSCGGSGSR